jgi:hypothetical protein
MGKKLTRGAEPKPKKARRAWAFQKRASLFVLERSTAQSFAYQIAAVAALSGCPTPAVADAAPPFEPEAICRTALASIMGRDPKIVRVTLVAGDVLFLSYVRAIDNFVWDYRCKIQGNRVVWASEPGRWREDPKDDKVFFEIVGGGKQLRIIEDHGDGSATKELFERDQIQ